MADNNQRPSNSRMAKLHPKGKPRKRIWLQIIKWFFIVAMLVVVSGVGLFAYYAKDAPSISQALKKPEANFSHGQVQITVCCLPVLKLCLQSFSETEMQIWSLEICALSTNTEEP